MNPELAHARLGKLTASVAAIVMGARNSDGLKQLEKKLAWERVYGEVDEESYQSPAMKRGNVVEAQALDWYEFKTDRLIDRGLHIDHPTIPYIAATPDAVIAGDRVIEAKSPLYSQWMEVHRRKHVPPQYMWQTKWQMWCYEVRRCDFVAWHPKPGGIIVECSLDDSDIEDMRIASARVEASIRAWVATLKGSMQ